MDNRFVASTYVWILLLPIFLRVSQEIPAFTVISPFNAEPALKIYFDIPFNWIVLYYSAIFLAFARLLYSIFCPAFLRQYKTSSEALAEGFTATMLKDEAADYAAIYFKNALPHRLSQEGFELDAFLDELRITRRSLELSGDETDTDLNDLIAGTRLRSIPSDESQFILLDAQPVVPAVSVVSTDNRSTHNLIWKFLRLQDVAFRRVRIMTTLLVIIGITAATYPFLQGLLFVITYTSS
ncbi:hypothetical protein [Pseudaestuariivita sp.]|uniref:hypothetical protein n=1 Tax=Pseudaestuariivita sp. TaxID=2211669 RepID=UPI00405A36D1